MTFITTGEYMPWYRECLMKDADFINPNEKYVMPGPEQIRFITPGQTLSLVLGSCISTVFIGKNDEYVVSANHIMIARERKPGILVKRNARQQIDDILDTYHDEFRIREKDTRCLHLVGAGKKFNNESFNVDQENIAETRAVLSEKHFDPFFEDTGSYYFATYSLSDSNMSVFIEDKLGGSHLSYIIELEKLFSLDPHVLSNLPASALKPCNQGFEKFVDLGVIVFITGEKNRTCA